MSATTTPTPAALLADYLWRAPKAAIAMGEAIEGFLVARGATNATIRALKERGALEPNPPTTKGTSYRASDVGRAAWRLYVRRGA